MSDWSVDWFEEAYTRMRRELLRPLWDAAEASLEPLIEIQDREEEIVVTVDLPCVEKKEDIRVHASEDSVDLRAKMGRSIRWDRWGSVQKGVSFQEFRKTFRLPSKVKPEATRASFKGGILRVVLPKDARMYPVELK